MREVLSRLRAALTPQALLLLAALFLLAVGRVSGGHSASSPLERRVEKALSAVEGAGEVRVVIRMQSRKESGASRQIQEEAAGAVVVAAGAGDPVVRMMLEEALCALLGLPPSAVSVMTGGE